MNHTESYGPGWLDCTIHIHPLSGQMHFDGPPEAVAAVQQRFGLAQKECVLKHSLKPLEVDLQSVIGVLEVLYDIELLEFHKRDCLANDPLVRNQAKRSLLRYCTAVLKGQPASAT